MNNSIISFIPRKIAKMSANAVASVWSHIRWRRVPRPLPRGPVQMLFMQKHDTRASRAAVLEGGTTTAHADSLRNNTVKSSLRLKQVAVSR